MVEQQAILSELNGQAKNMVQFFFWTGLRPSELIALQWDDIDWNRKTISVNKSLTQAANEFEVTKTESGRREVKIKRTCHASISCTEIIHHAKKSGNIPKSKK